MWIFFFLTWASQVTVHTKVYAARFTTRKTLNSTKNFMVFTQLHKSLMVEKWSQLHSNSPEPHLHKQGLDMGAFKLTKSNLNIVHKFYEANRLFHRLKVKETGLSIGR